MRRFGNMLPYVSSRPVNVWRRRLFSSIPPKARVDEEPPRNRGGPLGWASVVVLAVLGSGVVVYYNWLRDRRVNMLKVKSLGRPAIGGPFSLVDHKGRPVTDNDFRGKYMLVYFGFTYCPDICPAELTKLGNVMEELKIKGFDDAVIPVMITVDPRRDTVDQVAEYVREFHPRLIGLTGTPQQIQEVSKLYRVYSATGYSEEQLEKMDDYTVDHTIFFYLMGPDGLIRNYFGQQMTSEEVSAGVLHAIYEDIEMVKGPTLWSMVMGK